MSVPKTLRAQGWMRQEMEPVEFAIGGGSSMYGFTNVKNVAHANISAEQALCSNAAFVVGKMGVYELHNGSYGL
ncbi:unnamed protein product [Urochloa humidicola]